MSVALGKVELDEAMENACRHGDLDTIQRLVGEGVSVEGVCTHHGMTAAIYACHRRGGASVEIMQYIVSQGASITVNDNVGMTTVMHACMYNCSVELVQYLVSQGDSVSGSDKSGKTAMMFACEYNCSVEVVRCLLSHGASVAGAETSGMTALTYACMAGHNAEVVHCMLLSGASLLLH
jgi:ankyrin repeat protein